MKILHLGDLHLGKRVNEISMIEDQKFILDQIVTLVKEEKIDVILLCGDIYDKAIPTIEAIHLLDEFLEELSDLKVKVLMISGNHDSSERLSFGRNLFKRSNLYILHHNLIRKLKRLRSRKMDTILIFICFHL